MRGAGRSVHSVSGRHSCSGSRRAARAARLLSDARRGPVRPLGQRPALVQRQPQAALGRGVQARPERLGQHARVVQRVVRAPLDDAEVGRQGLQLVVGQRQVERLGQGDGAQPLPHRRLAARPRVLPGDHLPVEDRVVRDQHPALQAGRELVGDVREERRTLQRLARQTVDPHGAGIALRVDQRVPVVLDLAARVQPVDGRGDYPVVAGQAGGLHVNDRVSVRIRGRPRRGGGRCGRVVFEHGH